MIEMNSLLAFTLRYLLHIVVYIVIYINFMQVQYCIIDASTT